MKSGQLTRFDELALIFKDTGFYINTTDNLLSVDCLDLPLPVEAFRHGITWKLRVNNYDEEKGTLLTEIIDYDFPISEVTEYKQASFYFYGIEKLSSGIWIPVVF